MTSRPVRPRDAASLVLVRRVDAERSVADVEVLMGRRAPRHAFLPGLYVFPGGRLDRDDHLARPASRLRRPVARRVAKSCPPAAAEAQAEALAVAAVRETFEETGLFLGSLSGDGADPRDPSTLEPDLAQLDYVARAITPPTSPIRFHARFFMAAAETCEGRLEGSGELLDLRWVTLGRALEQPVADVTEFVLGEVGRRLAAGTPAGAPVPVFSYRNNRAFIRHE